MDSWRVNSQGLIITLVFRVPIQRDGSIEKLKDLVKFKRIMEWKYGEGKPRNLGDSPEPLTDYLNVSINNHLR